MSVVMKSNMRAGVRIDTGSSNNGSAKIASNILGNDRRIAVVRLSINVESLAMILVDVRFDFFERIAKFIMESIKQSGTERFAQESISLTLFCIFVMQKREEEKEFELARE